MSFLVFAAPITFIIIFVIFIGVFSSDSKKYQKKLSNSKQIELDRAREEALKTVAEIKRIKEGTSVSSSENYTHQPDSKALKEQKTLLQEESLEKQKSIVKEQTLRKQKDLAREQSLEKRQYVERAKTLKEQKVAIREQALVKKDGPVINKYQQYYNEKYNRGDNKFAKQRNFQSTTQETVQNKKLVFSKENIVRGLIAKEYLNKKEGRRL